MNEKDTINKALDKYSENLDQETINQLDVLRKKALTTTHKPNILQNISWPILGPTLAAMLLVVVLLVSKQPQVVDPLLVEPLIVDSLLVDSLTGSLLNDLDLFTIEVDDDLLADLDFIAWLENEDILEGELL